MTSSPPVRRLVTLADFNPSNLNALLENGEERPRVQTIEVPFGQVQSLLVDPDAACWREKPDAAVVWTRPQAVVPCFARALRGEDFPLEQVEAEVDAFVSQLLALRDRVSHVLVPSWLVPAEERGLGLLDLREPRGLARLVLRMNLRLCDRLADEPGFYVLDADRLARAAGPRGFHPKLWYMAKIPFGQPIFQRAAVEIKAALRTLGGETRKLVILDLDDTLWGGLVGESGFERLTLGGHDPVGEAFADFQAALRSLGRRGILLGIVSKNEESVALGAIDQHPEMILRRSDFAGWRINWGDKAKNVADLADELNLGLQSVVFIDDSPAERARVREALPEVFVPDWPADPLRSRSALAALSCFDVAALTTEDRERGELYRIERERRAARSTVGSLEDWLVTLDVRVRLAPVRAETLPRAAQLLNKTNQMNLTTRRLAETELRDWSEHPDHRLWTVHVEDRFGAQGLCGLLGLECSGARTRVLDFVLSCRVFGRRIEHAMLAHAIDEARATGCGELVLRYEPTAKNKPTLDFLAAAGLERDDALFRWSTSETYPSPDTLTVEVDG